jgi:hypothetical protein
MAELHGTVEVVAVRDGTYDVLCFRRDDAGVEPCWDTTQGPFISAHGTEAAARQAAYEHGRSHDTAPREGHCPTCRCRRG